MAQARETMGVVLEVDAMKIEVSRMWLVLLYVLLGTTAFGNYGREPPLEIIDPLMHKATCLLSFLAWTVASVHHVWAWTRAWWSEKKLSPSERGLLMSMIRSPLCTGSAKPGTIMHRLVRLGYARRATESEPFEVEGGDGRPRRGTRADRRRTSASGEGEEDMNEHTRKALEGSIDKWRLIVAGEGRDEGTQNCPLCAEFYAEGCRECPVSYKTGRQFCDDSPYQRWSVLVDVSQHQFPYTSEMIEIARAELAFLESLRT